jgi:hypothetical protein
MSNPALPPIRTRDLRVVSLRPLLSPALLMDDLPLNAHGAQVVSRSREEIVRILNGDDDRLLVVVGPCSVHDCNAALEYARRLVVVAERLAADLRIVMRVYFEKPRTTVGWKGLINDPNLDGSYAVNEGLRLARRLLLDIIALGLPAGCEFLDPITPQFFSDAVTWAAIGARTTESQVHRQLASGLSMPVGFKNASKKYATTSAIVAQRLDIADLVARLNEEPLTYLMHGHRELFHSNLLAWFFRCMPEAADLVFGSLTTNNPEQADGTREIRREKNNLDLWIRWPGRHPVVIENKVFSLPDDKQLEGYTAKATIAGETPALWLLSLSDPSWPDNRKELGGGLWQWLAYRELAQRIRYALDPHNHTYEAQTMRHYADVVDLLSDLVATVVVTDSNETVSLPADVQLALGDDKLTAPLAKLRARSVAQRVRQALAMAGIANITVDSGFTNALPLNSWFDPINGGPGAVAGWQVQGVQFRLAIMLPHLKGPSPVEQRARYDFAEANHDLFDFEVVDEILGTQHTPVQPTATPIGSPAFNGYNPDFVYRYKKAPGITIDQLESAAVAIAKRIISRSNES